jgi:hypothetical protein
MPKRQNKNRISYGVISFPPKSMRLSRILGVPEGGAPLTRRDSCRGPLTRQSWEMSQVYLTAASGKQ